MKVILSDVDFCAIVMTALTMVVMKMILIENFISKIRMRVPEIAMVITMPKFSPQCPFIPIITM